MPRYRSKQPRGQSVTTAPVKTKLDTPLTRRYRWLTLLAITLAILFIGVVAIACNLASSGGPPFNAAVVNVIANTSLRPWLDTAVPAFNSSGVKTSGGQTVYVQVQYVEAGQAVADIRNNKSNPELWIPDDKVWAEVLADKGNTNYQNDCVSIAQSPLVIAMWKPLAESLGWPGRSLGWLDVGSLAADQTAWAYYSGGQYGETLRLGHTHPGLSGTGAATLLAVVQAAQSKTEAVSAADVELPIVKASVGSFEAAVSWFSKSTDSLGSTMRERGISYLGAAVMYESTVIQFGGGDPALIPIYPFEGTFLSTHPACLNTSADATRVEAATAFRAYLIGESAQKSALATGFRPVNTAVPLTAPLDPAHGVDVTQPQIVLGAPSVETIYAVQDVWSAARKPVNLVMLIDTSGSMKGDKMDNVKTAADQFAKQMGDGDYLTLIAFSTNPITILNHEQVGPARDRISTAIQDLNANGSTTLYDAIGDGAAAIANTNSAQATNAMIVLSDGLDTGSYRYKFDQALFDLAAANNTTVFTIAYGSDADQDLLTRLAQKANGNFYPGDEASIAAIYDEMSAAFGGSAGVGR
jgi:Ca-activated chloride channel family protein